MTLLTKAGAIFETIGAASVAVVTAIAAPAAQGLLFAERLVRSDVPTVEFNFEAVEPALKAAIGGVTGFALDAVLVVVVGGIVIASVPALTPAAALPIAATGFNITRGIRFVRSGKPSPIRFRASLAPPATFRGRFF